jgi:hypothetical protein
VDGDPLQQLWDQDPEEPKMSKAEIQVMLQPTLRKSARGWFLLVWVYLAFIAITLVCEGMSMYAFRNQPVMLAVLAAMTVLTAGFLAYGIHIASELTAIDRGDRSLVDSLRQRLRFYRTKYEIWLWMLTATIPFLTFAVSTMADADQGPYRINKPWLFTAFTAIQVTFMYIILKIGHYPLIREQKAILADIEHQATTETDRIRTLKKTWRLWGALAVLVGVVLLILGILRAIS